MLRLIVLAVLVCGVLSSPRTSGVKTGTVIEPKNDKVFGCYHTNWSQYRPGAGQFFPYDIDPFLCTHLFYSFAKIANGVLAPYEWNDESTDWSKGMFEHFTDLKMQNPGLKTLLAVGGWTHGSAGFTEVVASASSRKKFNDHAIGYLRKWKFDGLDLDWEYPGDNVRGDDPSKRPENRELLTVWCAELRAAFEAESAATGQERLLLTAAVAAGKGNMDAAYEINKFQASLDWINLMSYDLRGAWESVTGHHTTTRPHSEDDADTQLLTVEWAANEWLARGTPASKLVLGMGSYGRAFTLAGAENGVNAPASGGASKGTYTRETGFWSYYEICEKLAQGFKVEEEPVRQIIYAHSATEWVGYDDINSLDRKGAIMQGLGLRGGMVWALDLDDFRGTFCGQGTWPLIKKMKHMCLGGDYSPPPAPTTVPTLPPTTRDPNAPTDPPTQPPTRDPNNPCAGVPDGVMVESGPCSPEFHHCSGGQIIHTQSCGSPLVFNEACSCCDYTANTPSCQN
ncbi:chitinase-3-like protein 1 [Amphiura filiformis]|uniref:chitinase-3-like protein 1 n=1 Tax=Amphiura filiformis TaxID=82378 RepID=UPI003B21C8B1